MTEAHYNQNYSKEEISSILRKIKQCIKKGKYTISLNQNRKENRNFVLNYNLFSNKQKKILLQIKVEDFCHSLKNLHKGFENETLYVFVPKINLINGFGEVEEVDVYTKFNLIENDSEDYTVVVSFHKSNKPIKYLFR